MADRVRGEGMRQAESALGWPARAGKLVLGIALAWWLGAQLGWWSAAP